MRSNSFIKGGPRGQGGVQALAIKPQDKTADPGDFIPAWGVGSKKIVAFEIISEPDAYLQLLRICAVLMLAVLKGFSCRPVLLLVCGGMC
jgi:hypothetical protein